uniref:Nuclease homologue n=1 Tax=Candidatus Kentrum sp. LPFa TaxID=2126335 RepID=A0A450VNA2_9GAMM|nr:MAG: nuclease homologue [Candidatus Kentron sp. LPFa]
MNWRNFTERHGGRSLQRAEIFLIVLLKIFPVSNYHTGEVNAPVRKYSVSEVEYQGENMIDYHRYRCSASRVVDGDTIDLVVDLGFRISIDVRVRLAGLDAPERYTDAGKKATARLKELAPRITSLSTRKTGKYGRWLGTLYDEEGNDLNAQLIREGHAREVA